MEDNLTVGSKAAETTPTEEAPGIRLEVKVPEETKTIMTIGSDEQPAGHNTIQHSVSLAVAPAGKAAPSGIKVRIKYPPNWKKDKFMKDGDEKVISLETANEFVRLGIASIIEQSETE